MKLAITGASGYIGRRVVEAAHANGFEVLMLSRRPSSDRLSEWSPFDLSDTRPVELPADVNALIHLAATTSTTDIDIRSEVSAAHRLIAASRAIGARFVFVSSQTASEQAPTAYGKAKWLIERAVLAADGRIIRPGQVYGGPERALFGTLVETVRKLPIIPGFLPTPYIQPVHLDDLVAAILAVVQDDALPAKAFNVGAVCPVSFTRFLQTIARERLRRYRPVFPMPTALVRLATRWLGQRISSRLGIDRLNSLFDLPCMETSADILTLGVSLRPLSRGMARSGDGDVRALIKEGRALLKYTLREEPASILIRRYVKIVRSLRNAKPIQLPNFLLHLPAWMPVFEGGLLRQTPAGEELAWRLNAAVTVAEASPQGARRFLLVERSSGFVLDSLRLARAALCEGGWRVTRLCLTPLVRSRLRAFESWQR